MKRISFLFLIIISIIFITYPIKAQDENINVRVGLSNYTNLQNISINNTSLQIGYNDNENFNLIYSMNANSNFSIKKLNCVYLKLTESFSSYADVLNYINESDTDYTMYPTLTDVNTWSIYIGEFNSTSEAEDLAKKYNLTCSIVNYSNTLGIYVDEELFFIYDLEGHNLQVKNDSILNISNGGYRGTLEFVTTSTDFSLINILSLDEYLYSVVPSEMPFTWNIEALKAQAVASRSYTYSMIKNSNHSHDAYDLCDSTHCQVYKGVSSEKESTTKAVDLTSGEMAYYSNEPITAFYYSSNGGYTESSSNVWSDSLEYLQSFADPYETGGKVWERTFTFDELTKLAGSIGEVHTVTINFYENSPRVASLVLIGENGVKYLEKENIRTFFSSSNGGNLESRNFTILNASESTNVNSHNSVSDNYDKDDLYIISDGEVSHLDLNTVNIIGGNNTTEALKIENLNILTVTNNIESSENLSSISVFKSNTDSITFSGKGWGHGVGMSQYGANSMANLGYSYKEILEFYYKGVTIY